MPFSDRLIRLASGRRLPRRTLRLRLTALYGGLFLACGAALLALTYVLVAHATVRPGYVRSMSRGVDVRIQSGHHAVFGGRALASVVRGVRISDLHQLVTWSGIALAIMALIAAGLGWIVAGRALRPLRTITKATREISATNLHRRLALEGRQDEVKELSDTIDALLTRLEDSFQAQRAFVANASHELRTPLTLSRAMLQFALADPALTLDSLKASCADALDAAAEHEQLLDALLNLAQTQQRIEQPETFDLAPIAQDVVEGRRPQADLHDITLRAAIHTAPISGDPSLARQLISNLVANALHHNHPGGSARVTIDTQAGRPTLTVQNTGPRVPADQIERLLQPFRRLAADRTADAPGHGLGLSIVAAIASAHDATLNIRPNDDGGLHVSLTFPPAPAERQTTILCEPVSHA